MPASLAAKHLISIQDCGPKSALVDLGPEFLMNAPAEALLSHLELIPPNPFAQQNNRKLPTILAVFTSALPMGEYPDNEPTIGYYTIFRRWEINAKESTSPSGFDHVSKKPHGDQTSEAQVRGAYVFLAILLFIVFLEASYSREDGRRSCRWWCSGSSTATTSRDCPLHGIS